MVRDLIPAEVHLSQKLPEQKHLFNHTRHVTICQPTLGERECVATVADMMMNTVARHRHEACKAVQAVPTEVVQPEGHLWFSAKQPLS